MTRRFDLIVRGGRIVDGSGRPSATGDIAIKDGWIVATGAFEGAASQEIDASGYMVTPGFIDVHTHYDGQVIWSDRMTPSSDHGVTTVLTGNCGIGFAPCRAADRDVLVSLMEGVEDIPEAVAIAGLTWDWETFPEYLDAIERRPRDIDVATLFPHSPLRVYAMGERGANREEATKEDLDRMRALTAEALAAGALGVGTSRITVHRTSKGEFIPSFAAAEKELLAIADALKQANAGIFQLVPKGGTAGFDGEFALIERIAEHSGRTVTYTQGMGHDEALVYGLLERANARPGVSIKAQVFPRLLGVLVGIGTSVNPFSMCPSYAPLLKLDRAGRVAALRNPDLRTRLLAEKPENVTNPVFLMSRRFETIFPIGRDEIDYEPAASQSIGAIAKREGRSCEEVCYDLLLEDEGTRLLMAPISNYHHGNLDFAETAFRKEDVVMGLGDGGAHYGLICDASYTTFALAYWTRDRSHGRYSVEEMVHILTRRNALLIGLEDRGLIAPGHRADLNIIDYDRLRVHPPELLNDLPCGGMRIHQRADGYVATLVKGEVIAENGVPTHARPGSLVRGAQKARAIS